MASLLLPTLALPIIVVTLIVATTLYRVYFLSLRRGVLSVRKRRRR
jgi:hypothetical protein